MYTKLFWKDFAERLVATLAQVALGLLTADVASGVNLTVWLTTLGISSLAVLVKCFAAAGIKDTVSPASFAPAAPDQPALPVEEADEEAPIRGVNLSDGQKDQPPLNLSKGEDPVGVLDE